MFKIESSQIIEVEDDDHNDDSTRFASFFEWDDHAQTRAGKAIPRAPAHRALLFAVKTIGFCVPF